MKTNSILSLSILSILLLAACGKSDEESQNATTVAAATPVASTTVAGKAKAAAATTGVNIQAVYSQSDEEYVKAIQDGNVRRVRSILESGRSNIHSGDSKGVSGLIIASSLKNSDVVAAILDNVTQGDVKVLDRNDASAETPIYHAVETGTPEIITLLRKKGANPNIYNVEQNFPLLIAAKKNDIESVKALIAKYSDSPSANLDLQNSDGDTAILIATKNGNREMIKLLKDNGANLNTFDIEGITPLIYATSRSDKELFDYLLSLGADINYLGIGKKTPLLYALENKFYDFAKYILDKGADPNVHVKDLVSPLQMAVSNDNADPAIVEYLIAKGAKLTDPQIPLGNVIGRSIHKGNAPVITKLIASGAKITDLEDKNNNGLLEALNVEDPEIALLMINNGAILTKTDNNGYTALALASKKKFKDVVEALISHGADVNQTSQNPKLAPLEIVMDNDDAAILDLMFNHGLKASPDSLLLRAVNNKNDNVIPVLLAHGANPNLVNNIGESAIQIAIGNGDDAAAKALADGKASLDVKSPTNGITPLSLAINKNDTDLAKYLIAKGANPNIPDNNGYTSLAYAAVAGNDELVTLLINHGADPKAVNKDNATIPAVVDLSKLPQDKKDQIKKLLAQPPAPKQ